LKKYLLPHVDVLVYCLMPTHYHVMGRVKQPSELLKNSDVVSAEISRAMQKLGISYTKAINKRFSRVGALFQGQFQGKPIQTYEHLLNLCVYIHANPVKDGLVSRPEEWEYSNFLEWMGLRDGRLVNREFIAENFGSPEEYQALISKYIKTRYLPDHFRHYIQEFE
jgi:putative transposase